MQQDGNENQQTNSEVNQKSRCNRDAVEESVNPQSTDRSVSRRRSHERLRMCFSAEVKVGRDRVLEELNEQVAAQQQRHRADHRFGRGFAFEALRSKG